MDGSGPEVFCITYSSPLESTPPENILNNQCDKIIQPLSSATSVLAQWAQESCTHGGRNGGSDWALHMGSLFTKDDLASAAAKHPIFQ